MSQRRPRAGGEAFRVVRAQISRSPVSLAEIEAATSADWTGAVVGFAGVVRNHDAGHHVVRLEYEAHPEAERVLREVAEEVAGRHPAVLLAAVHRVGALEVGEVALAAAAAAAHRAEAFAACAELVDEVKARVPIWKEQHFADGTSEWVGAL